MIWQRAFWGHKTPKIPKIPKIPKTHPGWALNRFWVSSNQYWPILVPYETHFRKEGGGSYYVNFWEISFLQVVSPDENSNLRYPISYIWYLNGLKMYHWGNYTLFYGFWEVLKFFGYVSTETAPPQTAPNAPKRVSPETKAKIGDFGHLKIWSKNCCKSTKIGPNIDFWVFWQLCGSCGHF